eukprot:scaffold330238_cov59-Tisochrysis_lutea.AAC.4
MQDLRRLLGSEDNSAPHVHARCFESQQQLPVGCFAALFRCFNTHVPFAPMSHSTAADTRDHARRGDLQLPVTAMPHNPHFEDNPMTRQVPRPRALCGYAWAMVS